MLAASGYSGAHLLSFQECWDLERGEYVEAGFTSNCSVENVGAVEHLKALLGSLHHVGCGLEGILVGDVVQELLLECHLWGSLW